MPFTNKYKIILIISYYLRIFYYILIIQNALFSLIYTIIHNVYIVYFFKIFQ